MRGSIIWFVLALAWGVDGILAAVHRNHLQAVLTAFFACCFLAAGVAFRKRERKAVRRSDKQVL